MEEIGSVARETGIDLIVFEEELTPVQIRNLEKLTETRILDRTAIILDVFARRARSREGKFQVELAQLQYLLPRLTGLGVGLSRLGGGIGTRGPGETKLEMDRRRIRKRIGDLRREVALLKKHRLLHRNRRKKEGSLLVSLVGYTNAGKSTLLNALSGSRVFTEDKLFATLDPTIRKVDLEGLSVLVSDTVGFIRNLPPQLITAFQATLEEISGSDLLIHLVDITHPELEDQIQMVRETLHRLAGGEQPELIAFNKTDRIKTGDVDFHSLKKHYPNACFISATGKKGLDELRNRMRKNLTQRYFKTSFQIPYSDSSFLSKIHSEARVIEVVYGDNYIRVDAEVSSPFWKRHYNYAVLSDSYSGSGGG